MLCTPGIFLIVNVKLFTLYLHCGITLVYPLYVDESSAHPIPSEIIFAAKIDVFFNEKYLSYYVLQTNTARY